MPFKLSHFIRENIEPILQAWEDHAKTLLNMQDLIKSELRDHAEEILMVIADDLDTYQSESEQTDKSKGLAPEDKYASSARVHGGERYNTGLTMLETISEFRALRASVESLWAKTHPTISSKMLEDIVRFNEAIDQAITESMEQFSTLKEKDARLLEAVLAASPDPVFILDIEGNVRFANKATTDTFKLDRDTIIGGSIFNLGWSFPSDFKEELRKAIAQQGILQGKFFQASSSGEEKLFEYRLAPVMDKGNTSEATVCVCRDITQQALAEKESWNSAHHDDLTGLPNRRLFMDRLGQEIKHAKRSNRSLSILFIDLDGFKEVNDSYGHEVGDLILRNVANRLNACVREQDTVARLGGDEFTVIVTGVDQHKDAETVAKSIIDAIAIPFEVTQRSIFLSASIGISCCLENTVTPDELLRAADQAMYKAKKSKSRVVLDS